MKCQKNKACVKQPANSLPDNRERCTGCDKIGKDKNVKIKENFKEKLLSKFLVSSTKKNTLIIMCGLPASGKNTWIKDFLKKNSADYTVVELDEIRSEIFGHQFHRPAEHFIIGIAKSFARLLLKQGKNVIINSTGLTQAIRNEWISMGEEYNCDIKVVWVKTPLKECLKRNNKRSKDKVVPNDVIVSMNNIFQEPYHFMSYFSHKNINYYRRD